jgi:hypothetical protein
MKRIVLLGLTALAGVVLSGADALACADKMVIVGRGLRPTHARAALRASILVYARAGGTLPAALAEGGLQKNLEGAGHRVSRVASEDELKKALDAGSYDLVLADLAVSSRVEAEADASPAHPTVLPTLYNPSPEELKAAEGQFRCVVKSPGPERDYLAAVDQAMAARAAQAKTEKKH